ncbi:50S ribosomal protein L29 [Methyloglobulus sp.]|uniref:50S ribosomal protein L29 n=1 Tax=Methyloglobulus sp. TaxID=2518622 RepID=UPI0039895AE3
MKVSELRQKSKDDLGTLLLELSRERFNLRMQKSTGQLSKPTEIKRVRRDIARLQTVLNEKAGV